MIEQDINQAYAELGLAPTASEHEIKAAWRRLVSQWHPDRNTSASAVAKMQRINRAVEAIRRAGVHRPSATDRAPSQATRPAPSAASDAQARAEQAAPGAPARTINRRVRLTLEEAAFGCTKLLQGKLTDDCLACEGAGYRVLSAQCPRCTGSGKLRERAWFGWPGAETVCDACQGSGSTRQTCADCHGTGKAPSQRYKLTVRFPSGVRDGDQLSVEGRPGQSGAPPAKLNIRVDVLKHTLLTLQPDGTVLCTLPVDGFAWMANRTVEVPSLAGPQALQLHREQLSYRLKGLGFPNERRGPRGDQLITVTPIFPAQMTTDQQILLDQLIAISSGPDAKGCDERLRTWHRAMKAWKRRDQAGT